MVAIEEFLKMVRISGSIFRFGSLKRIYRHEFS